METIETMLTNPSDLDRLKFDDPADDRRYGKYVKTIAAERETGRLAFSKIGGIYCRSQFMRREDLLLMDMITDEGFCQALFDRVAEHLTRVALEELQRTDSWKTGILVADDSANMRAPMFSPKMWEKYLLPRYARMIDTLRSHGCKHVFFHSDGNIGPMIDHLLAAGFEGFHPLEPRCNLDLVKLRKRYGKKILFLGGVCNTVILPRGDRKEIEAHLRPLIELGRDGGLVIGMASIGDDISPETYDYYNGLLDKYADYG
jgi:uroporphyrinogen decarboxylase